MAKLCTKAKEPGWPDPAPDDCTNYQRGGGL